VAVVLIAALTTAVPLSIEAAPIAASYFDVDGEGWTTDYFLDDGVFWGCGSGYSSSGGNPGGFYGAEAIDRAETCVFVAPAKFLGDLSAAVGGSLSFDLREVFDSTLCGEGAGGAGCFPTPEIGVYIYSAPSSMGMHFRTRSLGSDAWHSYEVALDPSSPWLSETVTLAEFEMVFADVTSLQIITDNIFGDEFYDYQYADLDNVVLNRVPEPSTSLLLALGLAGVAVMQRKRFSRSDGASREPTRTRHATSLVPLLAALAIQFPLSVGAAPIAASYFDVDDEGWTTDWSIDPLFGCPEVYASAGAYFSGETLGDWEPCIFNAPEKFLGDLTAAVGGSLSFDLREWIVPDPTDCVNGVCPISRFSVSIYSATAATSIDFNIPSLGWSEWRSYEIELDPSSPLLSGTETLADFETVFADVTSLEIFVNRPIYWGLQGADLDNVVLTPEPSTALLLAIGLAGLVGVGVRRRKVDRSGEASQQSAGGRNANCLLILIAALAIQYPFSGGAAPIAASYFDVDEEGWTTPWSIDPLFGCESWHEPSGGNPGGYLFGSTIDMLEACHFTAPDEFHGDLSAAVGGSLSFDLWEGWDPDSCVGENCSNSRIGVYIQGGASAISFDVPSLGWSAWNAYEVELHPSSPWLSGTTTLSDFETVLSDVTSLTISTNENADCCLGGAFLDNVVLTPEPSTALLLAIGLAGLAVMRRRSAASWPRFEVS
jgi:hypothetical protein